MTVKRLRVAHPEHVWVHDSQFDETSDPRTLKSPNVTDVFAKETLAIELGR